MSDESVPVQLTIQKNVLDAINTMAAEVAKKKKADLLWVKVKIWAVGIVLGLAGLSTAYEMHRDSAGTKVVTVVISGTIGKGAASADALIPAIKKAFDDKDAKAVVLAIDSPGGSPAEADRVNQIIDLYKEKTKKPVIAAIDGIGASAAYMIAIHADKVVAGRYALVGSIGMIIQNWDYHSIMDKVGVKQRVFASGKLKSMLNEYAEITPEAHKKAQEIVDRMAVTFVDEVKFHRKGSLKDGDWFTGEVWPANEAKGIGLIDEISTIDQYIETQYPGAKVSSIKPSLSKSLLSLEGMGMEVAVKAATSVFESLTQRN